MRPASQDFRSRVSSLGIGAGSITPTAIALVNRTASTSRVRGRDCLRYRWGSCRASCDAMSSANRRPQPPPLRRGCLRRSISCGASLVELHHQVPFPSTPAWDIRKRKDRSVRQDDRGAVLVGSNCEAKRLDLTDELVDLLVVTFHVTPFCLLTVRVRNHEPPRASRTTRHMVGGNMSGFNRRTSH